MTTLQQQAAIATLEKVGFTQDGTPGPPGSPVAMVGPGGKKVEVDAAGNVTDI